MESASLEAPGVVLEVGANGPQNSAAVSAVAKGEELILYLEPRPGSQLRQAIESLLINTSLTLGRNEALRYMPHVTMVGFFSVPDTAASQIVQATVHTAISAFFADVSSPQQQRAKQVLQPAPDSVLIDIEASRGCHQLIQHLQDQLPSLHIRLKAINHLSLCYWLESDNEAPPPESRLVIATATAQQARALLSLPAESAQWDIVLYSINNRSQQGYEPYPLKQIQRWQLPS
ncbi:hypothetical protein BGZ73_007368 [Actinomortierella ambigua]|nr:hypothetical protein BGZ73_007368 [Actinomortierella ambigua]